MTERGTLEQLRAWDAQAWEVAYPRFYRLAFSACTPSLSNSDREEVASQAVHALLDYLQRVSDEPELDALAATLGHNLSVSRVRRELTQSRGGGKVGSLDEHEEGGADLPDQGVLRPDQLVAQAQRAVQLRHALDRLRPPFGGLLRDRFLHELDYKELAEKYELSIDSIGVYLQRAKTALCEDLKKQLGGLKEMQDALR